MVEQERTKAYLRLNGKYLKQAEALLRKGDYTQASEKLWGAVAEMVKAVAADRSINLGTHRSLWNFIFQLHKQNPRLRLTDLFSAAESLHTNFYEDHLPSEVVKERAKKARELIKRLKPLI